MVGTQGLEPRLPPPKGGALTLTRRPGGEGRNRADETSLAGRVRCLTCHPQQARHPYRVIPGSSCPIFRRAELTGRAHLCPPSVCVSRYGRVKYQACTRGSQGRRDSNSQPSALEAGALAVELRPKENKKPPCRVRPRPAASVVPGSPGYPEASRFREWPSARMVAGRGWCHDSRLKLLGECVM